VDVREGTGREQARQAGDVTTGLAGGEPGRADSAQNLV
jgi:hypothetical protein